MRPARQITLTLAALGLALCAPAAFSSRPAPYLVTGTLTSIDAGQITVNGTTYSVQPSGPGLSELQQLHVGQLVDLILSGPPTAAATQVVVIHPHVGATSAQ